MAGIEPDPSWLWSDDCARHRVEAQWMFVNLALFLIKVCVEVF
jgi:hypothetical protein